MDSDERHREEVLRAPGARDGWIALVSVAAIIAVPLLGRVLGFPMPWAIERDTPQRPTRAEYATWPEEVRLAIEERRILVGFTEAQVRLAMRNGASNPSGEPYKRHRTKLADGTAAQALIYPEVTVVMARGEVVDVQSSRVLVMEPYRPTPSPSQP